MVKLTTASVGPMLSYRHRAVVTPNLSIFSLMEQLSLYSTLEHKEKFELGINLGLCVSRYLVSQKKSIINKFDMLFSWLLTNNITFTTQLLTDLNKLKLYLEYTEFNHEQYNENLIDLAVYRLHNLLAVAIVLQKNMLLAVKIQTELRELIQLIKNKQNEYISKPYDINFINLARLLEHYPETHNKISFITIYNKITYCIQAHLVNDAKINEWINDLNELLNILNEIVQQHPRDSCIVHAPFCVQSRKQKLSEFFFILQNKIKDFIEQCQNDELPVNKNPFCF